MLWLAITLPDPRLRAKSSTGGSAFGPRERLQDKIGYLLKRPIGRPPHEGRRNYASFGYRAQGWDKPRRGVARDEWHAGELYPRVGFIVAAHVRRYLTDRSAAGTARAGTKGLWVEKC